MCGIFGFVGKRERAASIDLNLALKSLHHRGPDDSGTYFGVSKTDPEIACAFAHTRLSIIDLSAAGHQPMTTEDGRYTIVYNGEIYNFRDIASELERLGDRFRSHCDTEVVLRAFARWGKDCLDRFQGMFAFAIWDTQLGSLFLARDRLGIKPLYYATTASGFAFASEVRVLMDCGVAERRISQEGLNSYLAFGSVSGPFTIVEGVRALGPGCWAQADHRDPRIGTYWTLPGRAVSDGEDVEARSATRFAVLSELNADVPVGVFLSGGIDSSAIVSLAASARSGPIHTFTVTFDEESYNEEKYASEVARRYGCDHHQVHLSANQALSQVDSALAALDQPSADGLNTYFVAKAARGAGLTVTLSGLGGDEVFGGYRHYHSFRSMLSLGKWTSSIGGVLPKGFSPFGHVTTRTHKLVDLLQSRGDSSAVYATVRGMFNDQQVAALQPAMHANGFAARDMLDVAGEDADEDKINLLTRLELSNYLRNTLLRDADSMSMAHSLEVRVPFLDHLLVESVLRIPGDRKLSRGINKPLLVSFSNSLPANVVRRPKMGFTVPLDQWMRGAFKPRVTEILGAAPARDRSILDFDAVARVWNSFERGERFTNYSRVWCLVALIAWCERNRVTRL